MTYDLKKAIASFTFGQLQDAATLIKTLERNGISTSDFLAYVDDEKRRRVQARERRAEINRRLPKCPTCGIPMVLREVHPPDPGIGDPGDPSEGSHWTCPKCRFGRYDPRPILEIRKSIGMDAGTTTPDPEGKPALPAHK